LRDLDRDHAALVRCHEPTFAGDPVRADADAAERSRPVGRPVDEAGGVLPELLLSSRQRSPAWGRVSRVTVAEMLREGADLLPEVSAEPIISARPP
jgi:hypothetical protein